MSKKKPTDEQPELEVKILDPPDAFKDLKVMWDRQHDAILRATSESFGVPVHYFDPGDVGFSGRDD